MSDLSSVFYLALIAAIGIFALVVSPKLDRNRIRENIEEHGGKVLEISKVWEWTRHYDRCYEVSYLTPRGKSVNATCRTNMWRGVYWINDRPPGLFSGDSVLSEGPSGTAEPIQCLDCGTTIPANKPSCPRCGWSYRTSGVGK
jgi:hypothetical protein